MSAFVLSKEDIDVLTLATNAMLRINRQYPGSYPLTDETLETLGKYADDLHNVYRALFITNIKAVNGRYGEDEKTLPKYTPLHKWDVETVNSTTLKKAAGMFQCYLYQIAEEPIYGGRAYKAFYDVFKLLCMYTVKRLVDWDGTAIYI